MIVSCSYWYYLVIFPLLLLLLFIIIFSSSSSSFSSSSYSFHHHLFHLLFLLFIIFFFIIIYFFLSSFSLFFFISSSSSSFHLLFLPFFTSISSYLYSEDTPFHFHGVESVSFPLYSNCKKLHSNSFFSRTHALWNQLPWGRFTTILICSSTESTVISPISSL